MIMDIKPQIEAFLIQAGGWVPIEVICARFCINERKLRAVGRLPGLLDDFAVTGDKGAIHHLHLSTEEFGRMDRRIGRHGISELRKRKRWRQGRQRTLKTTRAGYSWEKESGQGLLGDIE